MLGWPNMALFFCQLSFFIFFSLGVILFLAFVGVILVTESVVSCGLKLGD